jgi:hypothetical protein
VAEQPRPTFSRSRLVLVGVEHKLELITRRRWRRMSGWIVVRHWDDFSAERVVAREDAEVAQGVKVRRWHCGDEPHDQVVGLE